MLGKRRSSKDIADFMHCLSFLERRISHLYEKLSEKTARLTFYESFKKISQNTKKHSEELDKVATQICRFRINEKECAKRFAAIYESVESILKQIKKKNLLSFEELFDIISVLEGFLGEDSFLLVQLKTFAAMAPQIQSLYGVHLENFSNLLYTIAIDEEAHLELLTNIKIFIDKKIKKKEGNSPNVKYKNPDSWIVSAHSQQ